ncbi:MAG: radical SAM protein [Vicinamibacterales bacterium]
MPERREGVSLHAAWWPVHSYPASSAARDRFVLEHRGPRPAHDPWRYQDLLVEEEPTAEGRLARVATVFLTGRECPWRCVMCDLWRHTTVEDTPVGAIPAQILAARQALDQQSDHVTQVKLYNSGSFFDPHTVPESDYLPIASQLAGLDRVVVESHPSLIGPRVDRFLEALAAGHTGAAPPAQLEIAMGLETAHPEALERLHKRMTRSQFERSALGVRDRGAALRVFLLIGPPFVAAGEQDDWLLRSIDAAFSCGASVVSLIPTRGGNGAMEALASDGAFRPPQLDDVERSVLLAHRSHSGRGRILVDLWDLERLPACPQCFPSRRLRLHLINLQQRLRPQVACARCGAAESP